MRSVPQRLKNSDKSDGKGWLRQAQPQSRAATIDPDRPRATCPYTTRESTDSGRRAPAAAPGGFVAEARRALPGTQPSAPHGVRRGSSAPHRHIMQRGRTAPAALPGARCEDMAGAARHARNEHAPTARAVGRQLPGCLPRHHPSAVPPAAAENGAADRPFPARRRPEPAGLPISSSRLPPEARAKHRVGASTLYARLPSYLQRTAEHRAFLAPRRSSG